MGNSHKKAPADTAWASRLASRGGAAAVVARAAAVARDRGWASVAMKAEEILRQHEL